MSESEYNLAKAQTMTHVGSWSFDPVSGEVKASDELLRIMRLRPEETTQEAFARVVHPEDHDSGDWRTCGRGIDHGTTTKSNTACSLPDGTANWVYTIVEPSVNSAGKVVKLYGTTQDITERKQAEFELRNKTNELQAIFDSIGDGITVYDHDGRIQHHNLISPQLFPQETSPGQSCRDTLPSRKSRSLPEKCPVERALSGGAGGDLARSLRGRAEDPLR